MYDLRQKYYEIQCVVQFKIQKLSKNFVLFRETCDKHITHAVTNHIRHMSYSANIRLTIICDSYVGRFY